MKKLLLLFIISTAGLHLKAQDVTFEWAKRMGGTGWEEGSSMVIDSLGNIYTTGYFSNTVDFDPGLGTYNLTSAGNYDIFISKLDADGNFVWAKKMGGQLLIMVYP